MSGKRPKITAVIPALNERDTIAAVIESVRARVDEVILVDDGSTDGTGAIARERGAVVVSHPKNLGYDASIGDGFKAAMERGADIVLSFDADGQHLAESIPVIVAPILEGEADIVVGRRPYRARFGERVFGWVGKRKAGIDDPMCGLKAYRTEVYRRIGYYDRVGSIGTELLFTAVRGGFRAAQRDIRLNRRKDTPRFGRTLKANYKILRAVLKIWPL